MTEVQKILKDLNNNREPIDRIKCFQIKDMENGYFKISLTNGKYSYVTDDNFLKIKPYIIFEKKEENNPIETFYKNLEICFFEFIKDYLLEKELIT